MTDLKAMMVMRICVMIGGRMTLSADVHAKAKKKKNNNTCTNE